MLEEARRAVQEAMTMGFGDPRSTNAPGREAQRALEDLQSRISGILGGSRTVFFSDADMAGGTAVLAAGRAARRHGRDHVISSPVERSSIVSALRVLRDEGSRISTMEAGKDGRVLPKSLERLMEEKTGLVVCCRASGISGVLQPLKDLVGKCHGTGVWFHCDAGCAVGRLPVDLKKSGVDSLSFSSVQLGGPPGCAAVVLRDDTPLPMAEVPEFSFSCNIPGIFGMTAALESCLSGMDARTRITNGMRADALSGLDSCGLRYSIIGGKLEDLVPGAALLHLECRADRIHARMENEGIILPSHNSSERLSFLGRSGWDVSGSDSYLGFALDASNSCADVEHFVRSLTCICGG